MDSMTTTPNLPALIEARTPAVRDLAVGSPVRTTVHVSDLFAGLRGVVTEHTPEHFVKSSSGFSFTALEQFTVAINLGGGDIEEFSFSRHEIEAV